MTRITTCPDAATFGRMLQEQLAADEAASVEAHVEACPACEKTLDQMARAEGGPVGDLLVRLRATSDSLAAGPRTVTVGHTPTPQGFDTVTTSPPISTADRPPVIAGYELLGELGRGGSAVVYKARQESLGRVVALKILHVGLRGDKGAAERLIQEAHALAKLRHPNIVQVYDVGMHEGCPFFSLELVDGPTLGSWAGGYPQPPRMAARLVMTVAQAVGYAHENGILHRDLKPANVLFAGPVLASLRSASDPVLIPEVKVSDFGLAKGMHEIDLHQEPLTASGMLVGTPSYMAPEQARGAGRPIGPAADVYSLGVILYELLTGRPPFRAATPLDTLLQVVHDEPVSVARLQPRLPRDLATICAKCLEKNPTRRYAGAADLAADLRRFLDHQPILARPIGPAGRIARWTRRRPAVAGLLLALFGVGALAFALVISQWQEAVAARNRAVDLAASEASALAEAQEQRDAADTANTAARTQRDEAVVARRQAERAAAELLLDQSLERCERGDIGTGLAGLARGLQRVTAVGLDDLQPAFRLNIAAWAARHTTPEVSPHLGSSITSVAFTPDGRRILVGRWSGNLPTGPVPGQAQLWDTDGWTPVGPPLIHSSPVLAVAVSPDGNHLLTAGQDGAVQVWDAGTGRPTGPILRELTTVRAVAFAPDGRTFAAGGSGGNGRGEVRIWETSTGKPSAPPITQPGLVTAVAYNPDGTSLATGCVAPASASGPVGGQVCLWNPKTGLQAGPTLMHSSAVRAVTFDPTGKHIVTGCEDQTVLIWDHQTGVRRGLPQVCSYLVLGVAYGPDRKTILTGGGGLDRGGNWAQLWDLFSNRPLCGPMVHPDAVQSVAYRPDGGAVATGCRDGRVRLWKSDHLRPDVELPHLAFPPTLVSYSPDGKWLLSAGGVSGPDGGRSQVWEAATGRPIGPELTHPSAVTAGDFSPDGHSYTTGCVGGTVTIRETVTGKRIGETIEVRDRVGSVSYDPDGRAVTVFSSDGPAGRWDAATGRKIAGGLETVAKAGRVRLTAPDGRTVVEPGPGGSAVIRDAATNRPVGPELDHAGEAVRSVGFTAGGSRVYTIAGTPFGDRATVRLWDAATAEIVTVIPHQTAVRAVGCRPGSGVLATGGWEGDVRLWDCRTGRPIGPRLPCGGSVLKVVLSPDGESVAAVGQDCVLRVWRTPQDSRSPMQKQIE